MNTLFIKQFTQIDLAYTSPNYGITGESYFVDLNVSTNELDEEGVVVDFSIIKKASKDLIDSLVDHKLIIPNKASYLSLSDENCVMEYKLDDSGIPCGFQGCAKWGEVDDSQLSLLHASVTSKLLTIVSEAGNIEYRCPSEAITVIPKWEDDVPMSVALEEYLSDELSRFLTFKYGNGRKLSVSISLYTDPFVGHNYYKYTHGLKKHYGNCQRLVHGHRSFFLSNEPDAYSVIADLHHKHLVHDEDCYETEDGNLVLCYVSSQGAFWLKLPKSMCVIMPYETTVENIARFICDSYNISQVTAYEGINKGSRYRRV